MEALGMCLGASTLSICRVRRQEDRISVVDSTTITHEGNPRKTLLEALERIPDIKTVPLAVTGRKFINFITLTTISEPEAIEKAVSLALPDTSKYRVLVSAGGETFMVYHLDEDNKIQGIQTGNKCASGTGEFFLQQIGRMNIGLKDVEQLGVSEHPHKVSGRCSVFLQE